MTETNEALAEIGLELKNETSIRHMVEVLVEDIGYEEMGKHVARPLEGMKIAGYVSCQTNRPFGIEGDSFENPKYLDKRIETMVRKRWTITTRRFPVVAARWRSRSRRKARL
jgi:heterodisulfide reductase subunit B